ncbi:MAG: PspC domain-containing protein [Chitinophagales bacterium]|nr:PspC domain-containing protein [Chitinophagales bacterium]MDW8394021.1 PspC domain-containing protein [Chitinophagales bacterium]
MQKRLYRGSEKKLFGVCSGLSEYFGVDPTLIRAVFVVAFLLFGTGLLVYLVLAILMPEKPSTTG